jgi:hypothetical protein
MYLVSSVMILRAVVNIILIIENEEVLWARKHHKTGWSFFLLFYYGCFEILPILAILVAIQTKGTGDLNGSSTDVTRPEEA